MTSENGLNQEILTQISVCIVPQNIPENDHAFLIEQQGPRNHRYSKTIQKNSDQLKRNEFNIDM